MATLADINKSKVASAADGLVKALGEHASSAVVSNYVNLLVADGPLAVGVGGKLRLIVEYNSMEVFVWSYSMVVVGAKDHPIIIRGRQWDILWGRTKERIPHEGVAPSFAGGHLLLPRGSEPQIFETAIVTDSPGDLPRMQGSLDALNVATGKKFNLTVGNFAFAEDPDVVRQSPDIFTLDRADATELLEAIRIYRAFVSSGGRAIFRADRINVSPAGRRLINRFLFVQFRDQFKKTDKFDFSPLLSRKPADETKYTLETTDHYIGLSEQWVIDSRNDLYFTYILVYNCFELLAKPSSDAGLAQQLAKLRTTYGVEQVAKELLRSASPEDCALIAGMALSEQQKPGVSAPKSPRKGIEHEWELALAEFAPSLTEDERREILARAQAVTKPPVPELNNKQLVAVKRRAKARPWSGRERPRMSAFEWVRDNYSEWIPGLLQHHLKLDSEQLYAAFAQRLSREGGLPDWLDVPTEGEALLRATPDPIERAKILAVRRMGRDHSRYRRYLSP